MTIPFRSRQDDSSAPVAYVRVLPRTGGAHGYDGALFVANALGEPIEFVFSAVDAPRTVLWRRADLRRRATSKLLQALFKATTSRPAIIFAKADEVGPNVFLSDIEIEIPVCRVAQQLDVITEGTGEQAQDLDIDDLHLLWVAGCPSSGSAEAALVETLAAAGLLMEPFERCAAGLAEARGEPSSD